MPVKTKLSSRALDEKDKEILRILQGNGREQIKRISKKVGLSMNSTSRRIDEMLRKEIFKPTILIDPDKIGFPLIADIK